VTCLSTRSGISSNNKLSKSTFLNRCSSALVIWAMTCTISATKVSSGVILVYQFCTYSLRMMAMRA
jgi:hypothetical protein